ncbi:MAG: peptidoglycan DD-metalloendopeptidase family protein [Rhodobacteraceae bacterium]|nr:peptidoglycan DD-metalloendopeptidase family protein [Paracoccaceae bacterium]
MNPLCALILALGLSFVAAPTLAASDPVFAAQKAADDLKAATTALSDAREAGDRVAALSLAVKAYEDGLKAMRESLRKAAIREQALRLEFESRRDRLSRLLGVLQTLQRVSSPLLLIHPSGPLGTARSGQVLADVTPALHAQAEELRAQLEELLVLEALQTSAEEDLKQGLKGVQDARVALSEAIGQRTNLPKRLASDPEALKRLTENSDTLEGFAQGLADLPFEGNIGKVGDFEDSKGKIPLPVFGSLLRAFNEADAAGLRRPGIVVSAPPVSLVTAPWPTTIRYRGPFLDYGNVIILEPEAGYLIVLAGLGQVYGEVGQILAAGDPVGLMGGTDPAAEDFLVEAKQGSGEIRQETLYIEIRQGRTALDPLAWFALNDR